MSAWGPLLGGAVGAGLLYVGYTQDKSWLQVLGAGAGLYTLLALTRPDAGDEGKAAAEEPVLIERETVVVAFDFDKCLMIKHWFGTYRFQPIENINPGPTDFAMSDPAGVFRRLVTTPHVRVAVASFGRKDVISKAIHSVLAPNLAAQVYITTPGDFEGIRDGTGLRDKNRQLALVSDFFQVPFERIQFFDDDKKNIKAAELVGIKAVHTAPFDDSCLPLIEEHTGVTL